MAVIAKGTAGTITSTVHNRKKRLLQSITISEIVNDGGLSAKRIAAIEAEGTATASCSDRAGFEERFLFPVGDEVTYILSSPKEAKGNLNATKPLGGKVDFSF